MKSSSLINPVYISLSVALYCGALVADLLGITLSSDQYWLIGQTLVAAGIVAALFTIIPGIFDYAVVQYHDRAKDRAAIFNSAAFTLFLVSLVCRGDKRYIPMVIAGIELAGVICSAIATRMGDTLFFRNRFSNEE